MPLIKLFDEFQVIERGGVTKDGRQSAYRYDLTSPTIEIDPEAIKEKMDKLNKHFEKQKPHLKHIYEEQMAILPHDYRKVITFGRQGRKFDDVILYYSPETKALYAREWQARKKPELISAVTRYRLNDFKIKWNRKEIKHLKCPLCPQSFYGDDQTPMHEHLEIIHNITNKTLRNRALTLPMKPPKPKPRKNTSKRKPQND